MSVLAFLNQIANPTALPDQYRCRLAYALHDPDHP